jgi:type III pantothenate kinase
MRLGVVDIGNTRVKRAVWDGTAFEAWRGQRVEAWVGARVGRAKLPAGTLLLGRDFPSLVRNRTRTPESVGADRLAQASAAWARSRRACVVVGMGTAITIDVVNGRGDFLGGLIAPGLRMMARALHDGTALLPEIQPIRTRTALGRDTMEALECGLSTAAEGLIRRALREHEGKVYGTGGDAPLFQDLFDLLVPDLALEGVALSYLCSRSS